MTDNYYHDFLLEINTLIDNEKYEQAKVKLKHELELPYIPQNYETKMIELYEKVQQNTNLKMNPLKKWDLETIKSILDNPFDEEIHLVAFNFLEYQNVRHILPTLKSYLMNPLFRNENKTHLLLQLKKQEVNEELKVVKTHGFYLVNPILIDDFHNHALSIHLKKLLNDYVYVNDPSLEQICWSIWENYWHSQYPKLPETNALTSLASALLYKAQIMMGLEDASLFDNCEKMNANTKEAEIFLKQIEQEQIF